ncbi:CgeB family protein [Luteimonas rhizosphaerae]|uniref:CgeB family protein n=1 Tax=Luteimonas sp. 4-12 TaxID=2027406 RepID=UPI000C7D6F52|nr:glycosyltransferase [Luteimonas sp. 4-12]
MSETERERADRINLLQAQDRSERLYLDKIDAELSLARLQHRVALLEDSGAFRLGVALVAACRSIRGLLGLPAALLAILAHLRQKSGRNMPDALTDDAVPLADLLRVLPPADLRHPLRETPPPQVGNLRVAAVVDEFTEFGFSPECDFVNLPPVGFEQVLDDLRPHLLFVESCWRGSGNGWLRKIHPVSGALAHLIGCCRRRGIPTVFWNKEDPSHFAHFIDAARFFDHVFTTDADCVPRYQAELGHARVHVLRFGCQPRIHNPVTGVARRVAASFAGSWYAQYPERSEDLQRLIGVVAHVMPVEIHDRNADRGDPKFAFPAQFAPMMKGAIPYAEIAVAYKACWFGININTIKGSPTMFARRVYELLASNTLVISNRSVGMEAEFGDVVLSEATPGLPARLAQLRDSERERSRLQVAGLRKVLSSHTAQARLGELASIVLGVDYRPARALVIMLAIVRSPVEAALALETHSAQRWPHTRLILLVPSEDAAYSRFLAPAVTVMTADEAVTLRTPCADEEACWFAPLDINDYYGPHYVSDLALATLYAEGRPVGKSRAFAWQDNAGLQVLDGVVHAPATLRMRSSLVPAAWLDGPSGDWVGKLDGDLTLEGIATDAFNYCRMGAGQHVQDVVVA